jgi:ribosome-associated protein YbcJ (S4-like RNA binding protein)
MNYFRVALSNEDRRMKKLRGNESVEVHNAA